MSFMDQADAVSFKVAINGSEPSLLAMKDI